MDIGAVSQLQPANSLETWYSNIYKDKLLQRIFFGGGQGCGVADESAENKQAKGSNCDSSSNSSNLFLRFTEGQSNANPPPISSKMPTERHKKGN